MKKRIQGITYNTETADQVHKRCYGNYGDSDGYEEILYRTAKGRYFRYGIGGKDSPYPQPMIVPMQESQLESMSIMPSGFEG